MTFFNCKKDVYKTVKMHKEEITKDQVEKGWGNFKCYYEQEGSVVDNNFFTIFICNFRKSLTLRRLTKSKEK